MRRLTATIALLTLSLALLAPGAWREINVYDEGVAVYGAERVAAGEVPYRDFWTIYAPGDLYLIAGLFKIFGPRLVVERHAWLLLEGILAVLVYALARRAGANATWSAIAWTVMILWTRLLPMFAAPGIPALVCLAGALLLVLQNRSLSLVGVLIAGCALFRQDFGLYGAIAIIAMLAFAGRGWRAIALFVATLSLALAPVAVALVVAVPMRQLIEHLVTFPLDIYPRMRALPLPGLPGSLRGAASLATYLLEAARGVQLYGSMVVLAVALLWSVRRRSPAMLAIGIAGLLLLYHARVRSDVFHLYPAFLFAVMAAAALISSWRGTRTYAIITAMSALLVVAFAALSVRSEWLAASRQTPYTIARAAGLSTLHADTADAYAQAIAEVQRRVPPGEPIFVGNTRHDRLNSNDVLFYFLAERPSATAYHDMHPGVVTTAPVQEAMIHDLEQKRVACIVLRDDQQPPEAGNASGLSSGVTLLDRFIADHFAPGPTFGAYQLWTRKDGR
jgi:hypothetical protein